MVYKLHTLKRLYHLLPIVIVLLLFTVFRLTESMCGRPGTSPNCDYNTDYTSYYNMEHNVGDTVTYYCRVNPCYSPDSMHRQCLENGSWSGTIPFCHMRAVLENIEQMLLISGASILNANLTMDRKNNTCISTAVEGNTLWEAVFKRSFRVIAVKIIFPDRITEISTRVKILEGNRTVSKCDNHPRTDMKRNSQLFICPHGVIGNKIQIIPVKTQLSSEAENFEICEVHVFIQGNKACLRPDLPYMTTGLRIANPPKFVYECKEDYELVGDNTVYCQDDGTWTETSFKCQRTFVCGHENCYVTALGHAGFEYIEFSSGSPFLTRHNETHSKPPTSVHSLFVPPTLSFINIGTHCEKLPGVANGVIVSNSTTINSTAWLKCNEGFRPLSDHQAYCLPTGMWTSLSFSCELIKCDPTPVIPHGRAELPNGFTYGSIMHIICDQGYVAVEPGIRECHKNGSWGNLNICTQTICGPLKFEVMDGGQWVSLNETISIRVLICQTGYHIEGSPAFIQCLPNGSWSHTKAVCRKTPNFDEWNSEWTPSTVLLSAVAVGAGTAICILCLAMCCLIMKKRRQSSTNSSVFHVGVTDSVLYHEQPKEQHSYKANTYEDVIELRNNPSSTKPRKPSSALPHLPIFPVDTDPVYAQPFETSTSYPKTIPVSTSTDIYTAHIYAEPVDSHRPPSGPGTFTSAAETWLRSGAKKFGRKMSLPGRTLPEDSVPRPSKNIDPVHKTAYESSNTSSLSTRFDDKQKIADYEPLSTTFSELISNSIYVDSKEGRFTGKKDTEQLQMIDNDIYQDDYFSNV